MMEGLGLTKELVGLVSAIGIVPTLLICSVVLFFIIRELKKEHKQTMDSISSLRKHSDAKDDELRGLAIWALKALQYEPAFDKINSMAEDTAVAWIYEDGILQQKTIGQIMNKG